MGHNRRHGRYERAAATDMPASRRRRTTVAVWQDKAALRAYLELTLASHYMELEEDTGREAAAQSEGVVNGDWGAKYDSLEAFDPGLLGYRRLHSAAEEKWENAKRRLVGFDEEDIETFMVHDEIDDDLLHSLITLEMDPGLRTADPVRFRKAVDAFVSIVQAKIGEEEGDD